MTKINNIQIKNDVSNSKNQVKQAPWGNLFGRIQKAICKIYLKNNAIKLFNDFKEFCEKEEGKTYI